MTSAKDSGLPAATRQLLQTLHRNLLQLHKLLLDDERATYEKLHGRTPAGKMLQLVIGDSRFAWLRRISELIVQIDELLESEEPNASQTAAELMNQVRSLLAPADASNEFSSKYHDALQRLPDAVLAHKEVTEMLARDR